MDIIIIPENVIRLKILCEDYYLNDAKKYRRRQYNNDKEKNKKRSKIFYDNNKQYSKKYILN